MMQNVIRVPVALPVAVVLLIAITPNHITAVGAGQASASGAPLRTGLVAISRPTTEQAPFYGTMSRGRPMQIPLIPSRGTLGVRDLAASSSLGLGPWMPQGDLTAADGVSGDSFGFSVAADGDTAVVGALDHNGVTGAAYVFVRGGTTWTRQAELIAPDGAADNEFGFAVAVSGDTAIIGAPEKGKNTGAVYVFVRTGTTWARQANLVVPGGAAGGRFGNAIAISGDTVVVSAPGMESYTGAAYVFERTGKTWSLQSPLTVAGLTIGDYLGISVAVSGDTVVVGAQGKDHYTGAAYMFARTGKTWSLQDTLTAADGTAGDYFGRSVSISGDTVVIGAPIKNRYTGSAYVFVRKGAHWTRQVTLSAPDKAGIYDEFGSSTAVSGNVALIGAPLHNGATGAAYVFVRSGTSWSRQAVLTVTATMGNGEVGCAVALSQNTAVGGAFAANGKAGAAYVFGLKR